jgi:outer membrane murein-binding lipoprotein Lpp
MSDAPSSQKPKLPQVELGWNSLLVIALIVTVCSGSEHGSDRETRQQIDELREAVTRLEKKVDALAASPQKSQSRGATAVRPQP